MEDVLATYRQLEHALRYLGAIAEQTSEGVAVLDAAGAVQFLNPAWVTMHGYQAVNELVGRSIGAFLADGQEEADATAFIEQARQQGGKASLVEHLKSDGTTFLAEMRMTPVNDEAGRIAGLLVFAADVTQRRRLEELFRGNTRKAAQLAEGLAQLEKLLAQVHAVEESLARRATELDAESQELQRQLAEWTQSPETPPDCTGSLQHARPEDRTSKTQPSLDGQKADGRRQACGVDWKGGSLKGEAFGDGSSQGCHPQAALEAATRRTAKEGRRPQGSLRQYPLDAEELRKVAELGRRLAGPDR